MGQNNELQLLPPPSRPAPLSAFAAHGVWAPGVLIMRNLSFGPKALVIVCLFLASLLVLAFSYYSVQMGNIGFSAKERLGVRYLQAAYPVLDAALALRRDATLTALGMPVSTLESSRRQLDTARQALAKVEAELGQELGTADAFAAVDNVHRRVLDFRGEPRVTFSAHTRHAKAIIGLMMQATDGSNLTLDPDIDSYYLMDAAAFRLPDMLERVTLLREASVSALGTGELSAEVMQEMLKSLAIVEFHFENLNAGLDKSIAANPLVAKGVDATAEKEATGRFLQSVQTDVLSGRELNSAAMPALTDVGNQTLVTQFKLAQDTLAELDRLLVKRIDGMELSMWLKSSVILLSVLLAFYFFYAFFLVTRGGLRLISQHLQEMADGDLRRAPAEPWGSDEPAKVIVDLRKAYDSLHLLIRRVRHSARELTGTSVEIANSSLDLSARTEAAAASLEEQAAAMEQIGSQVADSAQRAQDAAAFSEENARVADKSRTVVNTVVGTMRDIQQSSSKIGDIIGVIDGIAFQTNILALNAAVEAARAGDAGRGFAVVAAEVRSLAQRSAEAAREIKGLITNSVAKVESGVSVVEQAGATMATLVSNAEQINQSVMQIAMGAREQASGVEQVGQAIQTLDSNTQQNAALVEETSAAAAVLKEQAELLQQQIANFRFS
jgi:methyl-accepting chemotaxis protein